MEGYIIDFYKKGNVVRFALGTKETVEDYYGGDDWDDAPYEHNGGPVLGCFVSAYVDIAYDTDWTVEEPADDYRYKGNSPYSKDDFKRLKSWCICATKGDLQDKFYFGDKFVQEDINAKVIAYESFV